MIDPSGFVPLKASSGSHETRFFAWLLVNMQCILRAISNDPLLIVCIQIYTQVSNNGLDFTADRVVYTVEQSCPGGNFCVGPSETSILLCPQVPSAVYVGSKRGRQTDDAKKTR